jgi:uncharacterized protein YfaS (alpha-2-macroglobulin family)
VLTFVTQPSTAQWYFDDSFGTVIEPDMQGSPKILRRNVELMQQQVTPIKTANELLAFLNGTAKSVTSNLAPSAHTINSLKEQALDFRKHLSDKKGLVHYQLSGHSADDFLSDKTVIKSRRFMAQTADYNVAIWHQQDLVLQFYDWQAKPLTDVSAVLVCEGQDSPHFIGKSGPEGVLWLSAQKWATLYQKSNAKECWVWSNKNNNFAAIKLPPAVSAIKHSVNAFAWSSQPIYQPGDVVNIGLIARSRSEDGLKPLSQSQLNDYKVELVNLYQNKAISLTFETISPNGIAHISHSLADDALMGNYSIRITHLSTGDTQSIGRFVVAEFTPPRFEQKIKTPYKVKLNEPLIADIVATRMNGVALKHATVKINTRVTRYYGTPDNWPDDYEFSSWEDFYNNKNDTEKLARIEAKLDDKGQFQFNSAPLKSTVPFGRIEISSEVISDDGESQYDRSEVLYFSRSHFIGTKFDKKSQQLTVIAIDENGSEITQLPVNIAINIKSSDKDIADKHVKTCQLTQLPNTCLIDLKDKKLNLVISSGKEQYKWHRDVDTTETNNHNYSEIKYAEIKEAFKLTSKQQQYLVGDKIQLNLSSNIAGKASFILQAGTVQKIWHQDIDVGSNVIEIEANPSLLPYARVYASLAVDRELANANLEQDLLNNAKDSSMYLSAWDLKAILGSQRWLKSEVKIAIQPKKTRPKIQLSSSDNNVLAGSEISLSITSDQPADSQIWLVNEALLPLMRVKDDDFDYYKKLYSTYSFEGELAFDVLSKHLILQSIFGGDNDTQLYKTVAQARNRIASGNSISFGMPSADMGGNSNKKLDFSQSVWLDTVQLKAGVTKTIKLKLPQLIGKWRVFALTATPQTMALDSTSITTVRDIEYFLDAPKTVFDSDQSEFAVTTINRSKSAINDKLTLWLGKQEIQQIDINLAAGEYARKSVSLPILTGGNYDLILTSELQPSFAAHQKLKVVSGLQVKTNTWLVNKEDDQLIKQPAYFVNNSLSLSTMKAGVNAPDWHALSEFNQDYAHQCWEQTISRAVSFQFNPVSNKQWPLGEKELNHLMSQQHKYQSYYNMYSYFPETQADPFLTAYTYLASKWLANSSTPLNTDRKKAQEILFKMLEDNELSRYLNVSIQAQSMALLALAENNDIDLEQALTIRQKLGTSSTQSALFQALALKALGANPSLYLADLKSTMQQGYKDTQLGIFNQNSDKCLAILAFDNSDVEGSSLLSEVLLEQQQKGHFGTTFANAICSFALKDHEMTTAEFETVDFDINNSIIRYHTNSSENHWLKMTYQQNFSDITAVSSGVAITRKRYVKREDTWQLVKQNDQLRVGELVKTTIIINSPTTREHIALTDPVPGGVEAINPALGNQSYISELGQDWRSHTQLEIRNGKVYWYLRNLAKGDTKLSYYSRVKHQGNYHIAPAQIEAMYRSDVYGSTPASKTKIID